MADGRILRDGKPLRLRGINWYGFERKERVAHGLWQKSHKEVIADIKALGFNAIRLPVSSETLRGQEAYGFDRGLNPEFFDKASGVKKSAREILEIVVRECDRQGIHVIIDHHGPHGEIPELWHTPDLTEAQWLEELRSLAVSLEYVPHFVGIDIKNEPHGSATWGDGDPETDWKLAAEKAARVILQESPNLLVFVEGIGDVRDGKSSGPHWWGGNLEPHARFPLDIPKDKLVLSPHVYGPDLSDHAPFRAKNFPDNMPALWDRHFGYLKKQRYAVAVGEFGARYAEGTSGRKWMDAFVAYLDAGEYDFFYWCYNPDSDHGEGLLQDQGKIDDWKSVIPAKYDALKPLLTD